MARRLLPSQGTPENHPVLRRCVDAFPSVSLEAEAEGFSQANPPASPICFAPAPRREKPTVRGDYTVPSECSHCVAHLGTDAAPGPRAVPSRQPRLPSLQRMSRASRRNPWRDLSELSEPNPPLPIGSSCFPRAPSACAPLTLR